MPKGVLLTVADAKACWEALCVQIRGLDADGEKDAAHEAHEVFQRLDFLLGCHGVTFDKRHCRWEPDEPSPLETLRAENARLLAMAEEAEALSAREATRQEFMEAIALIGEMTDGLPDLPESVHSLVRGEFVAFCERLAKVCAAHPPAEDGEGANDE